MRAAVYRGPRSVAEMVDRHQISNAAGEGSAGRLHHPPLGGHRLHHHRRACPGAGRACSGPPSKRSTPSSVTYGSARPPTSSGRPESQSCPAASPARTSRPCSWRSAPSTSTCKAGRSPSRNGGHAGPSPARSVTASFAGTAAGAAASLSAWPTGPASASRSCPCSPSTSTSSTAHLQGLLQPLRWRLLPVRSSFTRAAPTGAPTAGYDRDRARAEGGKARPGSSGPGHRPHLQRRPWSEDQRVLGVGDRGNPPSLRAAASKSLCELTHLSIRQYRRPNGEVAALLVIAPPKTDRERVIPMSAELFAVIAAIIRRHLRRAGP